MEKGLVHVQIVFFSSFILGFSLALGLFSYRGRSLLQEKMKSTGKRARLTGRQSLGELSSRLVMLYRRYGIVIDTGRLEARLFLAGRPLGLGAQEFIGATTALSCLAAAALAGMVMGGLLPAGAGLVLLAIASLLPWQIVKSRAKAGSEAVRRETMELCHRLQAGASAGVTTHRVLEWAAEGRGLLAEILARMMAEIKTGRPLHLVFGRIGMTYDIPEADELALIIKHGEMQGVEISRHLQELSRDMRFRKEMEISRKAAVLKPRVVGVMVLIAMVAVGCLVVAPVIMDSFREGFLKYM